MARHRSPRGRRAHQIPPLVALGRTVAGDIVRRSVSTPAPLLRGAALVAVAGGALASISAVASAPGGVDPSVVTAAQTLASPTASPSTSSAAGAPATASGAATARPAFEPVDTDAPDTAVVDAAKLVKAVQLAEKELSRDTAEREGKPDRDKKDDPDGAETDRDNTDRDNKDGETDADPTTDPKGGEDGPAAGSGDCTLDTSDLGAVKAHVRKAAQFLGCRFGEPTMFGVAGRGGSSDHPGGKAVDFMVDRATGDALAECTLNDREALGVSYVIWRQRINFGKGWEPMADRGGITANHFDHVHVSFGSSAGGTPSGC